MFSYNTYLFLCTFLAVVAVVEFTIILVRGAWEKRTNAFAEELIELLYAVQNAGIGINDPKEMRRYLGAMIGDIFAYRASFTAPWWAHKRHNKARSVMSVYTNTDWCAMCTP